MLRVHAPVRRRRGARRGRRRGPSRGGVRRPAGLPLRAGADRVVGHPDPGGVVHDGLRGLRRGRGRAAGLHRAPDGAHAVRLRRGAAAADQRVEREVLAASSSRREPRRRIGGAGEPRHVYPCHVRFSDVDVYGHVNNVKYFEYFQEARIALVLSLSGDGTGAQSVDALVVARIDVDYRRPILFRPEPYVVQTWVTRVGTSSFVLSCRDPRTRREVLTPGRRVVAGGLRPRRPSGPPAHRRAAGAPARELAASSRPGVVLGGVHHELGGVRDVVPELRVLLRGQAGLVEAGPEVQQPVLLGQRGHRERRVPHPQPRVAAGVGVRRRAAPVLHQEQREPLLRPARGPPPGTAAAAPRRSATPS